MYNFLISILNALTNIGRGNCQDDILEMSFVKESSVGRIFKHFVHNFAAAVYNEVVYFPRGEELCRIVQQYAVMGCPLACGSMDVTHVYLNKCPIELKVVCSGKEKAPTLAFQCICNSNKEIMHCSNAFLGSFNDKTITANDSIPNAIKDGLLSEVKCLMYDDNNVPRLVQGGYLIVDGGYNKEPWLIDPDPNSVNIKRKLWSEWMESVRKDIECTFGILKKRFRFFDNKIEYHSFTVIEDAFKSACIFHNLLRRWDSPVDSNVPWELIDPDSDEEEDVLFPDQQIAEVRNLDSNFLSSFAAVGDTIIISTHEQLTDLLVSNFYHNYRLGLVKWPHESTVSLRHANRSGILQIVPYNCKKMEQREAVYKRASTLMSKRNAVIGDGLFSCANYRKNDFIAEFRGVIKNFDEIRADFESGKSRYHILLSGRTEGDPNATFLQCYDNRFNGTCYASLSNSPKHCTIGRYGPTATANAYLVIYEKRAYLRAKVNIRCHTEILWDYGNEYSF